jgi:hypothetical protein
MQQSTKKSCKEPVFLFEMPHSLSHLIMKRGHMLRGRRTRTLCCLGKGAEKSWLEAKLIVSPGDSIEETWDRAHDLAARFRRELHSDVYVEPAGEHGRFKDMTTPMLPPDLVNPEDYLHGSSGIGSGIGAFMGQSVAPGLASAFGRVIGGHNPGLGNPFAMGLGGNTFPGMPHIPDPMKDILPPQVRQAMGMGSSPGGATDKAKKLDLSFPALRELPGWSDLPEAKQKMYEVEAAQLNNTGQLSLGGQQNIGIPSLPVDANFNSERALTSLTNHPKISGALKHLLLGRFEAALARQASADHT